MMEINFSNCKQYKVTIRHYVNTAIKPDKKGCFPIYVQVIANGTNHRVKSRIETRLHSDSELQKFKNEISQEQNLIEDKVNEFWGKYGRVKLDGILGIRQEKKTCLDYEKIREYFNDKHALHLTDKDINEIVRTIKKARIFTKPQLSPSNKDTPTKKAIE